MQNYSHLLSRFRGILTKCPSKKTLANDLREFLCLTTLKSIFQIDFLNFMIFWGVV